MAMISARRIVQVAKKRQRMGTLGRKHLILRIAKEADEHCVPVADKGHSVVYMADGKRYEVPLAYLSKTVFEELLQMSQEEFGFASNGRITLPCDAAVLEYAMFLLRSVSEEVEKPFLSTMAVRQCHATMQAVWCHLWN